jgi:cbb3-type cytochrome oxidase subunit 3
LGIAAIVIAAIAILLIAILCFMYQNKYRTKRMTEADEELSIREAQQNRTPTQGDFRMTGV